MVSDRDNGVSLVVGVVLMIFAIAIAFIIGGFILGFVDLQEKHVGDIAVEFSKQGNDVKVSVISGSDDPHTVMVGGEVVGSLQVAGDSVIIENPSPSEEIVIKNNRSGVVVREVSVGSV